MAQAVPFACCQWAASTTRSRSPSGLRAACTYGDLMWILRLLQLVQPALEQSGGRRHTHGLFHARRHRYCFNEPERQVVFFAIGFETTTPPTAMAIPSRPKEAADQFHDFLQSCADAFGNRENSGGELSPCRGNRRICGGPRMSQPSSERRPIDASRSSSTSPLAVAGFEPLPVGRRDFHAGAAGQRQILR